MADGSTDELQENLVPVVVLNLDTIPVEVLLQIFNFVDATDLLRNVSLVSKYFNAILSNEMTWKIKMEKRWGGTEDTKYPPIDLIPDESQTPEPIAEETEETSEPQEPPEPQEPLSPYTKIFTTSRFPWSRACVKREEQIKLWTTEPPASNLSDVTLNAHIGCIDSIHLFNRNNTMLLAAGSRDRNISIWNVEQALNSESDEKKNASKIKVLHRAHDGWIWDFAVNSNSLFSCSWDTTAKTWDLNTLQVTSEFKSTSALLSISSTNTTTAIGCFNRRILLLDPRISSVTATLKTHTRSVLSLGLDETSLCSCGEDGLVARFDLRTLKLLSSFKLPKQPHHTSSPYPTCLSFRETLVNLPYFYIGDNTGNIHLIDLLNFKIASSRQIHTAPVRGVFNNLGSVVSCSRDGKLVVSSPCLGLSKLRQVDVGDKIELPCVHSLDNVLGMGGGDGMIRIYGTFQEP